MGYPWTCDHPLLQQLWVCVSPMTPPSPVTWDLFCSWAWSVATAEKGLVFFWAVKLPFQKCCYTQWWRSPRLATMMHKHTPVAIQHSGYGPCRSTKLLVLWVHPCIRQVAWIYLMHTSTSDCNFTAKNQNTNWGLCYDSSHLLPYLVTCCHQSPQFSASTRWTQSVL